MMNLGDSSKLTRAEFVAEMMKDSGVFLNEHSTATYGFVMMVRSIAEKQFQMKFQLEKKQQGLLRETFDSLYQQYLHQ